VFGKNIKILVCLFFCQKKILWRLLLWLGTVHWSHRRTQLWKHFRILIYQTM